MSYHKDALYHEAAIKYNKDIRDFCNNLVKELEHPIIKGWARSVGRQHHQYMLEHKDALGRFKRLEARGVVRSYPEGKCAPWCQGGHPVREPAPIAVEAEHIDSNEDIAAAQQKFAESQNNEDTIEENTHDAG